MPHSPLAHDDEPLATPPQALPHPPQLLTSATSDTSQPSFCTLLLQSAKPALHALLHRPAMHSGPALLFEHTVLHVPQRVASFRRSASQPSAGSPLQSAQ